MDPLYPALPDDISGLTDEQLAEHLAELQARVDAIVAAVNQDEGSDPSLIEGRTDVDVVEATTAAVADITRVRNEQTSREQAATETRDALAALASEARGPEPTAEGEPEPEPVEGETATAEAETEPTATTEPVEAAPAAEPVEPEPEPVAASAVRRPRRLPARAAQARPVPAEPTIAITAAAEGMGIPLGARITESQIGELFVQKKRQLAGSNNPGADGEKVPVVRIEFPSEPESRFLGGDPQTTWQRIEDIVGDRQALAAHGGSWEALTAAGGLCAPVTPYYDLAMFSEAMRPVRDGLPRFNADRGGIRFMQPPALSAVTTGVGRITAAADALGGTNSAKTCQTVACPSQVEVDVAILFHCLRFGNLGTRAWPEQVDQFVGLTNAAFARMAETALLDGIAASSTAVTGAQVGGAINTLLGQALTAAAGMRNRHRMDPNRTLRIMLPAWVRDMLVVDLGRSQFGRFELTQDGVDALFRSRNLIPSYYVDGPTGASQVFGSQAAAALLGFPSTVRWFLFPEGSFIWLDGGTLELGLVRDSTLNAQNDYQLFGESFENVAFLGVESLQVTSTVCATGEVTAPRTLSCAVGP